MSESISADGRLAVGVAARVIPRASQPVCDDHVSQCGPVWTMMRVRRVARDYGFTGPGLASVSWDLAPGGQRFFVALPQVRRTVQAPITVVLNRPGLVKKQR